MTLLILAMIWESNLLSVYLTVKDNYNVPVTTGFQLFQVLAQFPPYVGSLPIPPNPHYSCLPIFYSTCSLKYSFDSHYTLLECALPLIYADASAGIMCWDVCIWMCVSIAQLDCKILTLNTFLSFPQISVEYIADIQ